ncbi:hypothetical protein D9756_008645 [Leucocoprinus leucothites]|uniref:F-box domain-containing protein n=1 Tax=Leucocoprinus leucothites TaxID=201217 RepID=A0A8H5CYT9_9AGAR|nr:hypothetical protein D9756_008645 [Leucoagaricus leucothites]
MSIASLPAEVLLAIFRDVFISQFSICSQQNNCSMCRRIGSNHVAWGPTQSSNTADPSLFPFALANVLLRWRDVLSNVPEYWTHPIFFLDGPGCTPTGVDAVEVLKFSKGLPLEVYITRRVFPGDGVGSVEADTEEEAKRMDEVMDALKPHLTRCQHIFIHTLCSSSLPSLRHDFAGHCPFLTQLKLECEIGDGVNIFAQNRPLPFKDLICTALYTLYVDGPNFQEIAMKGRKSW